MIHDIEQRSPEWQQIRLGKATASRIADAVAKTKTGWGASRANYAAELIAERLTGIPAVHYQNAAMQWGTETEDQARAAYEFYADTEVVQVGFVDHPAIEMSGASPDGLVGEQGLVELKCPNTATHIEILLGGAIPQKYIYQCLWQMACTQRQWTDWCSFDPRLPESMRLLVHRIKRDDELIGILEKQIAEFLAEIDTKIAALKARYEQRAA